MPKFVALSFVLLMEERQGLQATIIENISWDARSILVVVFLTASADFRPHFSNNNVHVAGTLLRPISLFPPLPPPNNVERSNKEVDNMTPINNVQGERGQVQLLPLNCPNNFFNDCSSR